MKRFQLKALTFGFLMVLLFAWQFNLWANDAIPEKVSEADTHEEDAKKSSRKAADVENEAWRASLNAEAKPEDPHVVSHAVIKNEDAADEHAVASAKYKKAGKSLEAIGDDEAARGAHALSEIHDKAHEQNRGLADEYKNHLKNIDNSDE